MTRWLAGWLARSPSVDKVTYSYKDWGERGGKGNDTDGVHKKGIRILEEPQACTVPQQTTASFSHRLFLRPCKDEEIFGRK